MTQSADTSSQSQPPGDPAPSGAFQIRLVHIFYAQAMLAATLALFGSWGWIVWVVIVLFWGSVFLRPNRPAALLEACVAVLVLLFCFCLLLPAGSSAREAARRAQCSNQLKQIALALHNYHDLYQSLPPAYIADENGRPMHSWRVLILPFVESQSLYEKYRFDEPWDGPNNRLLLDEMPQVYACPSNRRTDATGRTATSYVAVVGPETAWPIARGRHLREFADGTSNTLLVLETHGPPIPWMEPRDLSFEEAVAVLAASEPNDYGHVHRGFFYDGGYGRNVALADGAVQFVGFLPAGIAQALIDIDNGAADLDFWKYDWPTAYRRPNYGNWIRLGIFLLLLFLPLPWVWIHSNTGATISPRACASTFS
jgi:hypothetical protein